MSLTKKFYKSQPICYDSNLFEITYSAQTGGNGNGENNQGGDNGNDNSQGGGNTTNDEGCSGSVNSPVIMTLSLAMVGAFITIKSRKNKKS